MKKHNEGYALVLVLVVITVLCLVAMAMMAASLKNLQNQQSSIARMEAKYEAQGEIEKVVAKLSTKLSEINTTIEQNASAMSVDNFSKDVTKELYSYPVTGSMTYTKPTGADPYSGADPYFLLVLETTALEVNVKCTIRITGTITKIAGEDYISNPKWEYVSYTITEGGGAG